MKTKPKETTTHAGMEAKSYKLVTPPGHGLLNQGAWDRCQGHVIAAEEHQHWPRFVEALKGGPKSLWDISQEVYGCGVPQSEAFGLLLGCDVINCNENSGLKGDDWLKATVCELKPEALAPQIKVANMPQGKRYAVTLVPRKAPGGNVREETYYGDLEPSPGSVFKLRGKGWIVISTKLAPGKALQFGDIAGCCTLFAQCG